MKPKRRYVNTHRMRQNGWTYYHCDGTNQFSKTLEEESVRLSLYGAWARKAFGFDPYVPGWIMVIQNLGGKVLWKDLGNDSATIAAEELEDKYEEMFAEQYEYEELG